VLRVDKKILEIAKSEYLYDALYTLKNFLFHRFLFAKSIGTFSNHTLSSQFNAHNQAFIIDSGLTDNSSYTDTWLNSDKKSQVAKAPYIIMLGLRGFPNVQGGIESHAEHLAPLLVKQGCKVEIVVRSRYQLPEYKSGWAGVKFTNLWAPKFKSLEAIVHTFFGVIYAAVKRPDILHIQAIGPALMTPLARLLGLKVIVTHHGPDYDRQKWSTIAKSVLKCGEYLGMRFSNGRIVISNVIKNLVKEKHTVNTELIYNGVDMPTLDISDEHINLFGLTKNRYILLVSRLVPEKRHIDLMHAFNLAKIPNCKLVLVGASDHPDVYVERLKQEASKNPDIVLTGFQRGDVLKSLYTHAGLFVLPSSHEGLSISLLEALSYGLPVLASDIQANTEVGLNSSAYFPLGDVEQLSFKLEEHFDKPASQYDRSSIRQWVSNQYNWNNVAEKTYKEYLRVIRS
jgi:glycosyltransferase involved in cell wall biosynthesis